MTKAHPRARTQRALVRTITRLERELCKANQKVEEVKKNASAIAVKAAKWQREDAEILKDSLRNFSRPFYRQKKRICHLEKIIGVARAHNARLRCHNSKLHRRLKLTNGHKTESVHLDGGNFFRVGVPTTTPQCY